jgi:hypothetical protein
MPEAAVQKTRTRKNPAAELPAAAKSSRRPAAGPTRVMSARKPPDLKPSYPHPWTLPPCGEAFFLRLPPLNPKMRPYILETGRNGSNEQKGHDSDFELSITKQLKQRKNPFFRVIFAEAVGTVLRVAADPRNGQPLPSLSNNRRIYTWPFTANAFASVAHCRSAPSTTGPSASGGSSRSVCDSLPVLIRAFCRAKPELSPNFF